MKKSIYLRDIIWLIIFNLILFQNPLMQSVTYFRYIDELIFVFFTVYLFLCKKGRTDSGDRNIIVLIVLMTLMGVISNITSGVSRTTSMILLDIVYCFKVFFTFLGCKEFYRNYPISYNTKHLLKTEIRIIVLIAFVLSAYSQFYDIGMTRGVRHGIKCFQFIYSTPGLFSQYCLIYLLVLTMCIKDKIKTVDWIYFILSIAVWVSTGRTRAFAIISVWFSLLVLQKNLGNIEQNYQSIKPALKKLIKFRYIALVVVIVFIIGWDQFQHYFGDEIDTARNLLLSGGIRIMKDFFPFGTGFGTYGTEVAAHNYSPLYYKYGINTYWALTEGGSELTDCYWPAIGAEMGIFGLLLMAITVIIFSLQLVKNSSLHNYTLIAFLTYVVYLLISSTGTGIYFGYVTVGTLFILLSLNTAGGRKLSGINSVV